MHAKGWKALLLALAGLALVALPWSAGAEGMRLLAQAMPAYALFSLLLVGIGVLAWRGQRWLAATASAALLVGGFLYFFFLPGIALPPLLVLVASLVQPPTQED